MNQNLNHILLIGSGRLATHLHFYFSQLGLKFSTWDRAQDPHLLKTKIDQATHVLLAISDSAIDSFYLRYLAGLEKTVVHFSGAHHNEEILAIHPLMTFSKELYPVEFYTKIHFVISNCDHLEKAIPGMTNTFTVLPCEEKARYHAQCVSSGNFVSILAAEFFEYLQTQNIPAEAGQLYLEQSLENIFRLGWQGVTGPLVRNDQQTISKNLNALEGTAQHEIYQSFVKAYSTKWGMR